MLVEAQNEAQARELGQAALEKQHAERRRRIDRDVPVNILIVQLATRDEIEFCKRGEEMLAHEAAMKLD